MMAEKWIVFFNDECAIRLDVVLPGILNSPHDFDVEKLTT
jgi:hypothetical protein